jgi:MFS family permease
MQGGAGSGGGANNARRISMASVAPRATSHTQDFSREEKKVIFASSLGTVFEWYDFYLYAVLAPFFAALFFPKGNATAALLSAFAAYAAGFLVRPFGALVFGRIGDLVGRKYTFLVTILVMGFSTFATGLLPTYASIGWAAPILLVSLRLLQGLALGGEYGGAATYVAEHAAEGKRGFDTSWIQTTATLGLFLALLVIGMCRFTGWMTPAQFADWGWRLPFLVSLILLIFSVYIRLKLNESPVFQRMKAEGKGSKAPLTDSFLKYPNNKYVLLALLGATAGQGVVWYTGQFYALFFLTITLKVDGVTAYTLIAIALLLGTPFFIFFGWLSDKIGRLKIILAGCLIAALTYFPLFQALTHYVNPALESFQKANAISVAAKDCNFHIFVGPWSKFSDCDKAKDFLTKAGLSFSSTDLPADSADSVVTKIGGTELKGFDEAGYNKALADLKYPKSADKNAINWGMTLLILFIMLIYVTMVYGPIAAFLVELFPTRIRYTSMSLPYHIGNGWFGGMLPLLATALVAAKGDIYYGLWYPIIVALMTVVIGFLFLRDTKGTNILADEKHTYGAAD